MSSDYLLIPRPAKLAILAARTVVGGAAIQALASEPARHPYLVLAAVVYLSFGVFLFWDTAARVRLLSLAALAADTAFVAAVSLAAVPAWVFWAAGALLALRLSILDGWVEAIVTAAAIAAILISFAPDRWQDRAAVVAAACLVVAASSVRNAALLARLDSAGHRNVMLRAEAMVAREEERQRLADDFHDGPLQTFASLRMRIELIRRLLERGSHDRALEETRQFENIWFEQVAEVRQFVHQMRESDREEVDLRMALSRVVSRFEKDSGLAADFHWSGEPPDFNTDQSTGTLQLLRETLHNVRKHAHAKRVTVDIEGSPRQVRMSITDDGSGFPFDGTLSLAELDDLNAGPLSIRRRVRALDGALEVESRKGAGATVRIRIPA